MHHPLDEPAVLTSVVWTIAETWRLTVQCPGDLEGERAFTNRAWSSNEIGVREMSCFEGAA